MRPFTSARLVGVDAARGLAVLGMFAAHVGNHDPASWLVVAHGRSAATFALLAGVSIALLSGGREPAQGDALRSARVRIAVRAGLVLAIGLLLTALGTPVAVILPTYAVLFCAAALVLRWPPSALLLLAGAFALVGPALHVPVARAEADGRGVPGVVDLLAGGYYPPVVWIAYVLVGVAVGRADLRSVRVAGALTGTGVGLAAAGYGASAALLAATGHDPGLAPYLSAAPHDDTTFELVGNVGVALAVLGGLLALARVEVRAVRAALVPLASVGALALTVYTAQVVVIAVLGDGVVWQPHNETLVAFVVVALVASTAWRMTLGRGPLERLLHGASVAAADARA